MLFPGGYGCGVKCVNFKCSLGSDILIIQLDIMFEWMPKDFVDGKQTPRKQGVTWANGYLDLCRPMVPLGNNEFSTKNNSKL